MELGDFTNVILAISVVVLVVYLVPALIQFRKTLQSAEDFYKGMESSIRPLIENDIKPLVNKASENLDEIGDVVRGAKEGIEKIDDTIESFHQVADTVRSVNNILNANIKEPVINIASYVVGIKAGIETFVDGVKAFKHREVGQ